MNRIRPLLPALVIVWVGCMPHAVDEPAVTVRSDAGPWVTGTPKGFTGDIVYSEAVETPHVAWAKPYVSGKTRVLFAVQWRGGRDVVEMTQRFDLDARAVTFASDADEDAHKGLREELKVPVDCIVLAGTDWTALPEDVRKTIHEKTKSGTGLVLIDVAGQDEGKAPLPAELNPFGAPEKEEDLPASRWVGAGSHFITQGIAPEALPATRARKVKVAAGTPLVLAKKDRRPILAVHKFGEGRIVAFNYDTSGGGAGVIPSIIGRAPTGHWWEEQYALVGRAILWSAGRESSHRIAALTSSMKNYPAEKAAGVELMLVFEDEATCAACRLVELIVSDRQGNEVWRVRRKRSKTGPSRETFKPGRLIGGGRLTARAIVRDSAGRVLDFAACAFSVATPVRLTGIHLENILHRSGEALVGTVNLGGYVQKGLVVEVMVTDAFNRTCALLRKPMTVRGTNGLPFRFNAARMLSRQGTVIATLTLDGVPMGRIERRIGIIRNLPRPSFEVLMPLPTLMPHLKVPAIARLKTAGVTVSDLSAGIHGMRTIHPGWTNGLLELFDASAAEAEFAKTKNLKTLVRKPEIHKRETVNTALKTFAEAMRRGLWGLPDMVSLGEGLGYAEGGDVSFDDATLGIFRLYLKDRYKMLQKLDDAWGSSYASKTWDDVMPARLDGGNFPAWMEHRLFESMGYLSLMDYFADVSKKLVPFASVGMLRTLPPTSANGLDPVALYRILDWAGCRRDGGQLELQKLYRANCALCPLMPEELSDEEVREFLWRALFNGQTGVTLMEPQQLIGPDYTFTRLGAAAGREIRRIRDSGFATLMAAVKPAPSPVGVWYSYAGQVAAEGKGLDGDLGTFRLQMEAIRRLGYQPVGLTTKNLEAGAARRHRVLFAPYAAALSAVEAEKLTEFVKEGGILLAGPAAGSLSEVGRKRETSVLSDVLGPATKNPSSTLADRPVGKASLLHHHECGKGLGLYLNVKLSNWDNESEETRDRAAFRLTEELGAVLAARGIKPRAAVTVGSGEMKNGEVAQGFETVCEDREIFTWELGDHFFVGVLKDAVDMRSEPIIVRLDRQGHLYDVTAGRYIGFGREFPSSIVPGDGKLFAVLPYKVERVRIDAGRTDRRESLTLKVTIETDLGRARDHVLALDVCAPDGRRLDVYSGAHLAKDRILELTVPLVPSDPAGRWTVRVRDVLTGVSATRTIKVR